MEEKKYVSKSGATSGSYVPNIFIAPFEGDELVALRFLYGNQKHEDNNPIYADANWLKAYRSRDVNFFRERGAHAIKHIKQEMRGIEDKAIGGNIGGALWFCYVMAFIQKNDPFLYGAIQGKWNVNNRDVEAHMPARKDFTPDGYVEREKPGGIAVGKAEAPQDLKVLNEELLRKARSAAGLDWRKVDPTDDFEAEAKDNRG